MALPPDSTDIFLREVDENLRRDRARDFAKQYGGWLIAAVVLFLVASGAFIYWQSYSEQRSEQHVEDLAKTFKDIGAGDFTTPAAKLDELSKSSSKGVRASALFTRAALALQQNDVKLAVAKYGQVAGDDGLPQPYRDLAVIRQTALQYDSLTPDQVIARLQPLAKAGNPWFGTAGEMTAMAMIKQGKPNQAAQLFAAIARDPNVPSEIRGRAVQVAGSLGVDASGALIAPAQ